jgi:hypothetical protein
MHETQNRVSSSSPRFIVITKLFVSCMLIVVMYLPAYSITLFPSLFILYYLTTSSFTLPRGIAKYLPVPFILIIIGIAGSIGNDLYDVLKDGWYYITPFIILYAGYLVANRERRLSEILKLFVIIGWLLSLIHLTNIVINPGILFESSIEAIRHELGRGYFLSMISLIIILYARKTRFPLFNYRSARILIWVIIITDAISVILSFSRTLWISFIIMYAVTGGWFTLRHPKRLLLAGITIIVLNLALFALPKDQLSPDTMSGKIVNSFNEVLISDYTWKPDMQRHWRGYESYMAWQSYLDGSPLNIISGHGFGKLVDLKVNMDLGGEIFRYIPVLHNGYLYLLVKTGVIGFTLYLIFIYQLLISGISYANKNRDRDPFSGNLLIALVLVLLFTTFVISGMFNKGGLVPIILLIGILLGYHKIKIANHSLS